MNHEDDCHVALSSTLLAVALEVDFGFFHLFQVKLFSLLQLPMLDKCLHKLDMRTLLSITLVGEQPKDNGGILDIG